MPNWASASAFLGPTPRSFVTGISAKSRSVSGASSATGCPPRHRPPARAIPRRCLPASSPGGQATGATRRARRSASACDGAAHRSPSVREDTQRFGGGGTPAGVQGVIKSYDPGTRHGQPAARHRPGRVRAGARCADRLDPPHGPTGPAGGLRPRRRRAARPSSASARRSTWPRRGMATPDPRRPGPTDGRRHGRSGAGHGPVPGRFPSR